MLQYPIPKAFVTTAAVSSIAGGILLIAGFALHPAGEDATFGTDPLWVPAHSLLWAAYTVSLIGWIGAYIVQASKAGGTRRCRHCGRDSGNESRLVDL